MEPRVLVTCANGTVGSEVVARLLAAGRSVRAGVRRKAWAKESERSGGATVECDFERTETLKRALCDIDSAVLITPVSPRSVDDAIRFIDLARRAGVRRIVRLSGAIASDTSGAALGRWHRAAEEYLTASGLEHVVVRPTLFMQNFIRYYRPDALGNIYLPSGAARINHVDAHDVAQVLANLAAPGAAGAGRTFLATGPQALCAAELAVVLSDAAGRSVRSARIAPRQAAIAMRTMGMPLWAVRAFQEVHELMRDGFYDFDAPTIAQICNRPPCSFTAFARREAGLLRQPGAGFAMSIAARFLVRLTAG
jgi:uncharacterized protein YbjT (DUF2867 family)